MADSIAISRPDTQRTYAVRGQLFAIPLTIGLFAVAVAVFANSFWLSAATSAVALSLSVTGLAILYGQLGLVSLCQFALVGSVDGLPCVSVTHFTRPSRSAFLPVALPLPWSDWCSGFRL